MLLTRLFLHPVCQLPYLSFWSILLSSYHKAALNIICVRRSLLQMQTCKLFFCTGSRFFCSLCLCGLCHSVLSNWFRSSFCGFHCCFLCDSFLFSCLFCSGVFSLGRSALCRRFLFRLSFRCFRFCGRFCCSLAGRGLFCRRFFRCCFFGSRFSCRCLFRRFFLRLLFRWLFDGHKQPSLVVAAHVFPNLNPRTVLI